MSKFIQHTGIILPLNISNIDTDNIIPKQFLTTTTRSNLGKYLFFNWRFLDNTTNIPNPNFILNHSSYKEASILLARKNFGCGSSREHAVWALIDYGFKVIISSCFSNIFYKNCINNRLLPVILKESEIDNLFTNINTYPTQLIATINLYKKIIFIKNKEYIFKISNLDQNYLINDLDRIDLTLKYVAIIQEYENNQPTYLK